MNHCFRQTLSKIWSVFTLCCWAGGQVGSGTNSISKLGNTHQLGHGHKSPSLGTSHVPFPSSAQKVQIFMLAAFSFTVSVLWEAIWKLLSLTINPPDKYPFISRRQQGKKEPNLTYLSPLLSALLHSRVIFSELFNFFEPHHLLLSYGNIKISIEDHCCINWDNKCKKITSW